MSLRITTNVARPQPVTIHINGKEVSAYEGETVATALIAAGVLTMSRDEGSNVGGGRARSPFCNMGVCFDCLVEISDAASGAEPVRARACLTPVRAGLHITVPAT
ncbi:MAG TPA: (2Fe-2S)-binding protein [Steroidobacteraceae bacterium]|jgi:sarcosine oxidase subunit alpha|nr:(2Fe-2S)-binding protein [Steroidobacteraceae bacterium]